ncbi:probable G-protein coupled receptor 139 [Stegostoma tigrinum]|uniref:probable G-protein coupled receptor 139 n=1 Tax=Stegostoma tigrinum TaxID=3053191 RepID=UPI00287007BC|nr:probable G-protein coupled receptor 139 [Stegostoma tigrinum]
MEPFHSILKIYYTILAVIGIPVNLMTILILSQGRCGLSICTTRYLVSMTTADLLVIITAVLLYRGSSYYFPESFLQITPVCRATFVLLYAASECSVWFTVTFSFDRFVAICCQKLKTKYCTDKNAAAILSMTCILICFKNVAFYFRFEPGEIIDSIPWFCKETPSYYSAPDLSAYPDDNPPDIKISKNQQLTSGFTIDDSLSINILGVIIVHNGAGVDIIIECLQEQLKDYAHWSENLTRWHKSKTAEEN